MSRRRGDAGDRGAKGMLRPGLGLAALVVLLDQAAKGWILTQAMVPPHVIPVTGFFNLVLGWNRGISFGLFGGGDLDAWLLLALALGIVAALVVWLARIRGRLLAAALGLVIGGAVGNAIDRAIHGAVVDFLDFHLAGYHWPAFNLADAAITGGVALLLLDSLFARRE